MSAQSRGFVATDNPTILEHARDRWEERGDDSITVGQAWREAEPRFSGVHNARFERVHQPTGCTLIAYRIHPGGQSRVELRTVLAPNHDVVPRLFVENLLADGDRR